MAKDEFGFIRWMRMWPLVVAFIAIISSFVLMQQAVGQNKEEMSINRMEHKEIFSRVARLETVMEMLPEMRADIKQLIKHNQRK